MNKEPDFKQNIPEILAPAGTWEALEAGIKAGCDAVYLGGSLFSARAFAGNFDREEMLRAIDACHLLGVRVYMTVNTLLKPEEISQLEDYMRPYDQAGLDGVIVQDPGVARVLGTCFPKLHLHASTQMSIASSYGARLLKDLGFTRIVPARELSLEEIRSLKKESGMEIETFVHGAMCYAYSGKCLFSSFLGGRSGNRGRCAQPCRKCYEIQAPDTGKRIAKEYIMSLKDMCTLQLLPRLVDAGIDSFKIEGRMKNPSYVAATVDAYRTARDTYLEMQRENGAGSFEELPRECTEEYFRLAEELTGRMQDIYNRGGFHTGYYVTEKGPEMTAAQRPNHMGRKIGTVTGVSGPQVKIRLQQPVNPRDILEILVPGIELTSNTKGRTGEEISLKGKELKRIRPGMEVYRTRNQTLLDQMEQEILQKEPQIPARARIIARINEPVRITIFSEETGKTPGISITEEGDLVQRADSKPTDPQQLLEKLLRTGGSHVTLQAECEADPDIFIPMSAFNALRRKAVDHFKQAIKEQYHR